jgi:predicted DNA-binding WGR domain protein
MPNEFGWIENTDILRTFLNNEIGDCFLKDSNGKTFYELACEIWAVHHKKIIEEMMMIDENHELGDLENSEIESWLVKVNLEQDYQDYMSKAKANEEEMKKEITIPVDPIGNFGKTAIVYKDENGVDYDCYMVKVDLKNGYHAEYVFYKMQVVYDPIRDLYQLFTRYGRIGENGMMQTTPFPNAKEGTEEFEKIFKKKSGNDWANKDNFVSIKKKYKLLKMNYHTIDWKDYLIPFEDLQDPSIPRSKLHHTVQDFMKLITTSKGYRESLNSKVDSGVINFSNIDKKLLDAAEDTLDRIDEVISEIEVYNAKQVNWQEANLDDVREMRSKLMDLSSKYYELVPDANYKNSVPPVLSVKY